MPGDVDDFPEPLKLFRGENTGKLILALDPAGIAVAADTFRRS